MTDSRRQFQTVWGIALVLAGIGVFYRIPQVMPQIESAGYFPDALGFVRFCFYFLGVALLFGGGRKLIGLHRGGASTPDAGDDDTTAPPSS